MEKRLDQYILEHSTSEDPVLEELYRQTYIRFVNPNMVSGYLQGRILEMISKMIQPEYILEIGTFTGYSAICLAKGLKRGGRLFTIESNDELTLFAGSYFKKAGLSSVIEQLHGNALDIIPGLELIFDLVYIDGDKREYIDYYNHVIDKVKPGGFLIADNVLEFNEMIRKKIDIENIILPVRDGLMIIRKTF
jgi:predicted O-methyltransferase YrrM